MITQAKLKERLNYNPFTGVFSYRVAIGCMKAGDEAGYNRVENGKYKATYRVIGVDGKCYMAHRLAFLYMKGKMPLLDIDHIDGNGTNNVWSNLRESTKSKNSKNAGKRSDNKSGVCGVSWSKSNNAWVANINSGGERHYLGSFKNKDDAKRARLDAESRYGFDSKHGKRQCFRA